MLNLDAPAHPAKTKKKKKKKKERRTHVPKSPCRVGVLKAHRRLWELQRRLDLADVRDVGQQGPVAVVDLDRRRRRRLGAATARALDGERHRQKELEVAVARLKLELDKRLPGANGDPELGRRDLLRRSVAGRV